MHREGIQMPTYEKPVIVELGSLEELTLNENHKPCTTPDGMSGNIGNASNHSCGGS
jgi:hypothetical protein